MVGDATNPQVVECRSQDKTIQATIYYDLWNPTENAYYSVHFIRDEFGHLVASSYNVFDPLCSIRGVLESLGLLICCNGSRREAWASGLAKRVGGGHRIFITRLGHPTTSKDLVFTFAPADTGGCVSLAAQLHYHVEWMCSICSDDAKVEDGTPNCGQFTAESRWRANGVVYKIDGNFHPKNLDPDNFPESVLGAWKLDDNGLVVEPFTSRSKLPAPKDIDLPWH